MGTKVAVASSAYNLAGDETKRINYLKATLYNAIKSNNNSFTESITNSYLKGPGIRLRHFNNWADSNEYTDLIGVVSSTIQSPVDIDLDVIKGHLTVPTGEISIIELLTITKGDTFYRASEYILSITPQLINTNWGSELIGNLIKITYADNTTVNIPFNWYDKDSEFLYVKYHTQKPSYNTTEITDNTTISNPLPSIPTGYTLLSSNSTPTSVSLKRIELGVTSYTTVSYNEVITTYISVGNPIIANGVTSKVINKRVHIESKSITSTTTLGVYQESLVDNLYYIDSHYTNVITEIKPTTIFHYKKNSGNSLLDTYFATEVTSERFLPFIPLRIDNKPVDSTNFPDAVSSVKKAFNHSTGRKDYYKILDKIEDNPNIVDIDYCYLIMGVSLNTKDNAGKEYIYRFFRDIKVSSYWYDRWLVQYDLAIQSQTDWFDWYNQSLSNTTGILPQEPIRLPIPISPGQQININANTTSPKWGGKSLNYSLAIRYGYIIERTHTGSSKEVGELWWDIPIEDIKVGYRDYNNPPNITPTNTITLNWQVSEFTYTSITIADLYHINNVYKGNSINLLGLEALRTNEESEFIIPLNDKILYEMSLVKETQLTTSCFCLVFNSYTIKKTKWYKSNLFAILVLVIVVISAVYSGGTSIGLLGSDLAFGTSLGLSGTSAIIAGAVSNYLAAMVVAEMLSIGSNLVFGDKYGKIASNLIGFVVGLYNTTGSLADSFSQLTSPSGLWKLGQVVMNGYSDLQQVKLNDSSIELQEQIKLTEDKIKHINKLSSDMINSNLYLLQKFDITNTDKYCFEKSKDFLNRTLLKGSDISEISLETIHNFVEASLTLER